MRPVEERDTGYHVMNLALEAPAEWRALPSSPAPPSGAPTEESDLAYQSRRTAAIISLNSVCRASYQPREGIEELRQFSRQLLIGNFSTIEDQAEKSRTVAGTEALETAITGSIVNGSSTPEKTRVRVIVIKKGRCVYDLMLLSRPETFSISEGDFNRFVDSFRFQ